MQWVIVLRLSNLRNIVIQLQAMYSMTGDMPIIPEAVIIAYDIIATGGTMAKAIEIARDKGVKELCG